MASGDTIAGIIREMPPSGSNMATIDILASTIPVYDFDDTTSETMAFLCQMSGQYNGTSSIDVIIPWKFSTYVGSQTCDWEAKFYRLQDDVDTADSISYAAARTVLDTEANATGELSYATITFTNAQADGVQPGELFILGITRDATGGTASPGDAEMLVPLIQES